MLSVIMDVTIAILCILLCLALTCLVVMMAYVVIEVIKGWLESRGED